MIIEFPNRSRGWVTYPTFGALALAPVEIKDALEECPCEPPTRQVEIIPFPGAWENESEEIESPPIRSPVCILKTRIRGTRENSENFSRTYEDPLLPLSAHVYRLASRSPPDMVAWDAENPYKFVSRQYDVQTDLYYLRARFYSARNGRFLTQDPFLGVPFDPQTLHRYTYAYQNPTRYYDLTGYFAIQAVSSLPGLVGGIVNAGLEAVFGEPRERQEIQLASNIEGTQIADVPQGIFTDPRQKEREARYRSFGSFILDVLPFVGTAKSVYEFAFARDPVTGEEIGRGPAFIGLAASFIPGGKGVVKVGGRVGREVVEQAGEATAKAVARTTPRNLAEKLVLDEAKEGAGKRIMQGKIIDPKYPEDVWAKMQHVHENPDGTKILIHYWENLQTGAREGFKFK